MTPTLDFWFEFASSYSYPAAIRIEALARERGVEVVWRPFLLGPIFAELGWRDSPFNLQPAKGRYMWRDLARVCGDLDLAFRKPTEFPRNGLLAARVACRFDAEAWVPDFVRAVYCANFADDRDISDPVEISKLLAALGQPAEPILREAREDSAKAKLRKQGEHAASLGIFGAPSFVADGELFWGNDRLEAALDRLPRRDPL